MFLYELECVTLVLWLAPFPSWMWSCFIVRLHCDYLNRCTCRSWWFFEKEERTIRETLQTQLHAPSGHHQLATKPTEAALMRSRQIETDGKKRTERSRRKKQTERSRWVPKCPPQGATTHSQEVRKLQSASGQLVSLSHMLLCVVEEWRPM